MNELFCSPGNKLTIFFKYTYQQLQQDMVPPEIEKWKSGYDTEPESFLSLNIALRVLMVLILIIQNSLNTTLRDMIVPIKDRHDPKGNIQ